MKLLKGTIEMSTIVGVVKDGHTAVAWNSSTSVGSTRNVNAIGRPKVRRVGKSLLGFAGLSVYYNILDDYLKREVPSLKDEPSIFEFFLGFWRQLHTHYHFVDDKYDENDPSPFADLGAEFLVANEGGIFRVKEILSVSRFEKFCVIGSGAPHAEGALHVLYSIHSNAKDIAQQAVCAAREFDTSSGGEIKVEQIPMEQEIK